MGALCWCLLCAGLCLTVSGSAPDEVLSLPGLSSKPGFRQWSGYLEGSPGHHLHYWFVTSQRDPSGDPLVLWLNGGPGCSSLDGFLSENGPFHVRDDGQTLYVNEFSWNLISNVLYLESPAGVGYSYTNNNNYTTTDTQVAEDNYLALQDFFTKFPNFTKNEFYVIGESYGGIYTPTLSLRIATGASHINLQGFAVGNGLSSRYYNDQSVIYFGYYHGLFGELLWEKLNRDCCKLGDCNFHNNSRPECRDVLWEAYSILYESGLNMYSLYMDCAGGVFGDQRILRDLNNLFHYYSFHTVREAHEVPPCINSSAQTSWLNLPAVRAALHIPPTLPAWELCSDKVTQSYVRQYVTMEEFYLKLLWKGLRGLVYNGDTDMACNFLGDQWFVESLNLKKTREYQMWIYNEQIAGFYEQFGNLTFLTIKGAGHMVPQEAPGPAFHMFKSFLSNSDY